MIQCTLACKRPCWARAAVYRNTLFFSLRRQAVNTREGSSSPSCSRLVPMAQKNGHPFPSEWMELNIDYTAVFSSISFLPSGGGGCEHARRAVIPGVCERSPPPRRPDRGPARAVLPHHGDQLHQRSVPSSLPGRRRSRGGANRSILLSRFRMHVRCFAYRFRVRVF